MVTIEIAGKKYEVPEGITVIKAMWYAGQEVVRGVGCLGGFCGACATYYRTKDDPKVRTCLACQMAVQDGMSFTLMPPFPARKAIYDIQTLKDPKQDLFNLYPEAPLCRNCNACTEACPQKIDVREGVWKAVFGDFKSVSEMFMDCVMCGMCAPVCIADIAPNLVALYVSRAQGAHFTEKPQGLDTAHQGNPGRPLQRRVDQDPQDERERTGRPLCHGEVKRSVTSTLSSELSRRMTD